MTDETARRLTEAGSNERVKADEAETETRALLAAVASELPDHVERLARRVTREQPDVALDLGREGVDRIRTELRTYAEDLAAELRDASVDWPAPQSQFSRVEKRHIRSALFNYLYGSRTNGIAAIFKNYGFSIRDDNAQRSQGLVLPQHLFSETDLQSAFAAVAETLNALGDARSELAKAKTAHDHAAVDALWD